MIEPTQALTLKQLKIGIKSVPADKLVWVLSEADGFVEVEYHDHRGRVPSDSIVTYPIKPPSIENLRKLDSCFGLPDSAFVIEHFDEEAFFTIRRCKAHGSRFLVDTRGRIFMYELTTLLDDGDTGSPQDIWRKYHTMSDGWLYLRGRTM